jgi:quinolinate synthase
MNSPQELHAEIRALRAQWGDDLLILGHHYQRAAVLEETDERGDSLELARLAAARKQARRIVFCGVRFMAESADILTEADQAVYMPVPSADCPMARMADADAMRRAWTVLRAMDGDHWLPVVYVNSTAEVKACCGEWGGSACTSGNATAVFRWALERGKKIFFLPDEHLGTNTAHDLGLPDDAVCVYDARRPNGGLDSATLRRARVAVWKGFCLVHAGFTAEAVQAVRQRRPAAKIIVHPECPRAVVELADAHGSTARIIEYVKNAPAGSEIVIGTELHLVERLAQEERGRVSVKALAPVVCANMAKTDLAALRNLLRDWPDDSRVRVAPATADRARLALGAMLRL